MKTFAVLILLGLLRNSFGNLTVVERILPTKFIKNLAIIHCENLKFNEVSKFNLNAQGWGGRFQFYNLKNAGDVEDFLTFKPMLTYVWLDLNCQDATSILYGMSELKLFNGSRRIFIHGEFTKSIEILKDQNINLNSEVILLDGAVIYQVRSVELRRGTKLHTVKVGSKLKWMKRSFDLEGHKLTITFNIPKLPPGQVLMEYMKGKGGEHKDNINRLGNRYLFLISEILNFKVHWIRANTWGYRGPDNKTFNGSIGFLQRHEAVMSTSACYYTLARHPIVDPAFSIIPIRMAFLFRHPKVGRGVRGLRSAFLRPLNDTAWISAALLVCLVCLSLIIVHYKEISQSISSIILTVIGVMSQQGIVEHISTIHSKIIIFFTLCMSLLLFQFYSASIVGSLLTPMPKSIRDLNGLMDSDLTITMEEFLMPIFAYYPWLGEFYRKKVQGRERFITSDEAPNIIQHGLVYFGYLDPTYDEIRRTFSSDEIDELQEVQFFRSRLDELLWFPIEKYSPFKEPIRVAALWIVETGNAAYWRKNWVVEPLRGNFQQFRVVEVDLMRVKGVLYLMAAGIFASFGIFLGEIIWYNLDKAMRRKAQKERQEVW